MDDDRTFDDEFHWLPKPLDAKSKVSELELVFITV